MKVAVVVAVLIALVAVCSARTAVRVAHASPGAPAVDVYVNGTRAFSDVSLYDVTRYHVLAAATYNFKVVPAGQQSPAVIDATVTLQDETPYTIAAVNKVASIQPQVIVDDLKIPGVGQALVRFAHLSPDAPAVDVVVKNGPTLFKGVKFQQVTDYISVAEGTYDVQVKVANTNTVALEVPSVALSKRRPYTAWAEGLVNGGTLRAVLSEDL